MQFASSLSSNYKREKKNGRGGTALVFHRESCRWLLSCSPLFLPHCIAFFRAIFELTSSNMLAGEAYTHFLFPSLVYDSLRVTAAEALWNTRDGLSGHAKLFHYISAPSCLMLATTVRTLITSRRSGLESLSKPLLFSSRLIIPFFSPLVLALCWCVCA